VRLVRQVGKKTVIAQVVLELTLGDGEARHGCAGGMY